MLEVLTQLSAEQILAIPEGAPEKLFSGDLETAKSEYRVLGRHWHPDQNPHPQALRVFQHILMLYRQAKELIENDSWRGAGVLELYRNGNLLRYVEYFKSVPFELGEMFIAENAIVFSIAKENKDLFENAKKQIASFKYANSVMEKEVGRYLPQNPEYFSTPDRLILVLPKSPDLVLLADLRDYLGGEIAPQHVGWIQNGLHNLICYFNYAGITHNDISLQTYFVSPRYHYGVLPGGWWYACRNGEKLKALPNRTVSLAPSDVLRHKRADARVDLELIRAVGREMLGDPNGSRLKTDKKVPAPMSNWLNGATTGQAVLDYQLWRKVLEKSFGKPRFIKLDVEVNAIYQRT
jgi:hypothetical protein